MGVKQWGYGAKFHPETGIPMSLGHGGGIFQNEKLKTICAATIMADSYLPTKRHSLRHALLKGGPDTDSRPWPKHRSPVVEL